MRAGTTPVPPAEDEELDHDAYMKAWETTPGLTLDALYEAIDWVVEARTSDLVAHDRGEHEAHLEHELAAFALEYAARYYAALAGMTATPGGNQ